MYNITLPILGTRLKQIREHIGYSQAQLAEQLNCKQNAISNLELGKGGSLKLLFQVLNFYSNYVLTYREPSLVPSHMILRLLLPDDLSL